MLNTVHWNITVTRENSILKDNLDCQSNRKNNKQKQKNNQHNNPFLFINRRTSMIRTVFNNSEWSCAVGTTPIWHPFDFSIFCDCTTSTGNKARCLTPLSPNTFHRTWFHETVISLFRCTNTLRSMILSRMKNCSGSCYCSICTGYRTSAPIRPLIPKTIDRARSI